MGQMNPAKRVVTNLHCLVAVARLQPTTSEAAPDSLIDLA